MQQFLNDALGEKVKAYLWVRDGCGHIKEFWTSVNCKLKYSRMNVGEPMGEASS
jgi:hypothetical protein